MFVSYGFVSLYHLDNSSSESNCRELDAYVLLLLPSFNLDKVAYR